MDYPVIDRHSSISYAIRRSSINTSSAQTDSSQDKFEILLPIIPRFSFFESENELQLDLK